jgi:hypothetical protein
MTLLLVLLLYGSAASPGLGAFSEGRFQDALRELDDAVGRGAEPKALALLQLLRGRCLAALQRTQETETAFETALTLDPEVRLDAEDVAPALVGQLEAIRQRLHGVLSVSVRGAPGGQVHLDGTLRAAAPWSEQVSIGRHWVEVRRASGELMSAQVAVVRRDATTEVTVEAAPAAEPRRLGLVPALEARVLVDVQGGVGVEAGGGVIIPPFAVTADLTVGAGVGATLRAAARAASVVGPVGGQISVDGVFFFTPTPTPGGGPSAALFVSLGPLELFAEVSLRWLAARTGFRSSYILVGGGLRWLVEAGHSK